MKPRSMSMRRWEFELGRCSYESVEHSDWQRLDRGRCVYRIQSRATVLGEALGCRALQTFCSA